MCHIPQTVTIEELEYILLLLEIDPYLTTIELLHIIQERRDSDDTVD